jgi:hypothetical protein
MKALRNLVSLTAILGAALAVNANTITLTPSTVAVLTGTDQSQADINTAIAPWVGSLDSLYKSTQSDASEDGAFAGSYSTTYGTLTAASAVISYGSGPFINSNPVYALIKDGKLPQTGGLTWYLFDISGWNGTDSIAFSGFFDGNQGKISHVDIYGKDVPVEVPDNSATLFCLGLGLLTVAFAARKLKRIRA